MPLVIVLPFHQDQRLAADSIPLPPGIDVRSVEPALPDGDKWQRLLAVHDALAEEVASSLAGPGPARVLNGDCLAMLGTMAGAQRSGLDPAVVWFDAHGDVHTLASSTSGYLGGMPLRMLVGADRDKLVGPLGVRPLAEDRVLLVDARDLDPAEVEYLAASPVRRRSVEDVGVDDLPDGPVILHVDLDVVDPAELPGVRFPAPGGPSAAAVLAAVHRLRASGRVAVLDVSCPWFEAADADQDSARGRIVTALLGG